MQLRGARACALVERFGVAQGDLSDFKMRFVERPSGARHQRGRERRRPSSDLPPSALKSLDQTGESNLLQDGEVFRPLRSWREEEEHLARNGRAAFAFFFLGIFFFLGRSVEHEATEVTLGASNRHQKGSAVLWLMLCAMRGKKEVEVQGKTQIPAHLNDE